jgi:oxygen-independent coproporphyrinogen-3 oxidase
MLKKNGYIRYEISNFALPWKQSIHNLTYRNYENWLGLWAWGVSLLDISKIDLKKINLNVNNSISRIRFSTTKSRNKFFEGIYYEDKDIEMLNKTDVLYEEFMMKFRTKWWISNVKKYEPILVNNYEDKIREFEQKDLANFKDWSLKLTDKWMDFYNYIFSELVK